MKNRTSAFDRLFDWVNVSVLLLIATVMLFPFLYLFSVSFSSLEDFLASRLSLWPSNWTTDAYEYILESRAFRNSMMITIVVTVIGTLVNLIFTGTMAYALSRQIIGQPNRDVYGSVHSPVFRRDDSFLPGCEGDGPARLDLGAHFTGCYHAV